MTPLAPLQAAAAALSMANSIKGLCEQTPSADELVNKITERIQQIVHTEFANDNIKKAIARFSTAVNFFFRPTIKTIWIATCRMLTC